MTLAAQPNAFPWLEAGETASVFPAGHWILRWREGRAAAACTWPLCGLRNGQPLELASSRISDSGDVDGPVICPCGWFDYVTLIGWAIATGKVLP